MPPPRPRRALYNTPTLRTGGFGALQLEAVTNRPLSIARRHLAASQLRMRDIEPDELSSSEWVRFLAMEERERERWMGEFVRRRRGSAGSSASAASVEGGEGVGKGEEARREAARDVEEEVVPGHSRTPSASLWARQFDEGGGGAEEGVYSARRPRHARRAVTEVVEQPPPTYESAVRARTPPPAYEPRSDDEGVGGPRWRG